MRLRHFAAAEQWMGQVSRLDEATVRAMLAQHFEHARSDPELAHAMYHDDAVLEFPPSPASGFSESRTSASGEATVRRRRPSIREVRGRDDLWVAEGAISYDDGPWNFAVTILEFRGDKIARETIYVDEGWEAPEQRARWRAAP